MIINDSVFPNLRVGPDPGGFGDILGYFHPGIFPLWDTEPHILNDTLNDPSSPYPHLWFTHLPRDN